MSEVNRAEGEDSEMVETHTWPRERANPWTKCHTVCSSKENSEREAVGTWRLVRRHRDSFPRTRGSSGGFSRALASYRLLTTGFPWKPEEMPALLP